MSKRDEIKKAYLKKKTNFDVFFFVKKNEKLSKIVCVVQ